MAHAQVKFDLRHFLPHLTEEQVKALADQQSVELAADHAPMISCVLPFGEKRRMKLARKSIAQFLQQTYSYKQLVIANASGEKVWTGEETPLIKEIVVPSEQTIGALRNAGIEAADGEWIKPWDDDDVFDPNFLAFLMAHRTPGKAVLLRFQVRVNIKTATAFRHEEVAGIANTILHPKTAARYGDIDGGDDDAFAMANWTEDSVVVPNAYFPATGLNIAVYHGNNVSPAARFMGRFADSQYNGKWHLSPAETSHLRVVLESFGLHTNVREEAVEAPSISTEQAERQEQEPVTQQ